MAVWIALIPVILQLAEVLIPLIVNWLKKLHGAMKNSPAARKIIETANPQTYDDFMVAYSQALSQAIDDSRPTKAARQKLENARMHLLRPKTSRATWNMIVRKTGTGTPVPEVGLTDVMAEMEAPLPPDVE